MTIDEWLMVIRMAIDPQSPFLGLIDLEGIFKEPLDKQQAIYELLSDEERARLKEVYG